MKNGFLIKFLKIIVIAILLVLLLIILLPKKNNKTNDNQTIKFIQINNCKECLFSINVNTTYVIDDNIPDEMSIEYTSDNYVNDYTLLKNEDGNQINSFLGFILNDDKKIVKGYACGIMNNNPFCLENDINKYEEMKEMLNEIYNKKDCVEYEYDFHCYGNVNADIDKFGNIYVEDKNYYCSINNGSMNCVPR